MKKILTLLMFVVLVNTPITTVSAESINAVNQISEKTGVIKSYNEKKKFGFIKDDESGRQIYFNESGLIYKPINQGDKVTFDVIDGRSGPIAVNVKKI
jgi:CspA family cold shock protein